jgi:hypothetical protein
MNAFPPPSTPPAAAPHPPQGSTRRRGLVVGAFVALGALIAGGVVVGVALAADDDEPSAAEADLAAQTDDGGLDAMFDAMDPFITCLGEELELDELDIPENSDDVALGDLPAIVEEAMTAGAAAFEACSDQLPAEFPDIVPGAELLDELAELDLDDLPALDELWAELGEVLDLPTLDEVETQLDETLGELPSWEEMQEEFERHRRELEEKLGELDLGATTLPWLYDLLPDDIRNDLDQLKDELGEHEDELDEGVEEPKDELDELEEQLDGQLDELEKQLDGQLDELEKQLNDLGIPELAILEELFEDFDPGTLPGLDEIFGQLDEEFGDLDLESVFEDLLGGSATDGDTG